MKTIQLERHIADFKIDHIDWSVVIPTLDEEPGIGATIQEILAAIGDPEIIVIDANSADKTRQIASRLGAKVIKQVGRGKGKAIRQILPLVNPVTKYLILIDGDYSYPAKYIPQMIKILEDNHEIAMVTGKRNSNPGHPVQEHVKRLITDPYLLGNRVLATIHRILNRVKMKDPLSGLRIIKYDCLRDFRPKSEGFDLEVELNNYIRKKKNNILEIPIEYRPRLGKKKLRIKDGFTILARMVTMTLEDLASRTPK
jgi:dolichol-phosphate mannosyltransferase